MNSKNIAIASTGTDPSGLMGVEISMPREDAGALLRKLDAFGDDCSAGCKAVRTSLAFALQSARPGSNVTLKASGPGAAALAGFGISYVLAGGDSF